METPREFRYMIGQDIKNLQDALSDTSNFETPEVAKLQLYKEITAKYHPYVPKLSEGLYGYIPTVGFYDVIEGESLSHNLSQILNKLKSFKALGYPALTPFIRQSNSIVVNNKNENTNSNTNTITISFDQARQQVENMTSLPDDEIEEILRKVNELEQIVQSPDRKSKKWENAKGIIRWIADKGVDVGITLLPLLLQIK